MAKGCIVAQVLPLRCFIFLLPNCTNILVFFSLFALFSDEPEVFLPEHSQTAIPHAVHFRRVGNIEKEFRLIFWVFKHKGVLFCLKIIETDLNYPVLGH